MILVKAFTPQETGVRNEVEDYRERTRRSDPCTHPATQGGAKNWCEFLPANRLARLGVRAGFHVLASLEGTGSL